MELGESGRDFQAEVEDLSLALQEDVLWPSKARLTTILRRVAGEVWGESHDIPDHATEVSLWLNILTDAEVAWPLLEERILCVYRQHLGALTLLSIGIIAPHAAS